MSTNYLISLRVAVSEMVEAAKVALLVSIEPLARDVCEVVLIQ
jgi:hypothetical protein